MCCVHEITALARPSSPSTGMTSARSASTSTAGPSRARAAGKRGSVEGLDHLLGMRLAQEAQRHVPVVRSDEAHAALILARQGGQRGRHVLGRPHGDEQTRHGDSQPPRLDLLHGDGGLLLGRRVAVLESVGLDDHPAQHAVVDGERRVVGRRHRRAALVADGEADDAVGDGRRRRRRGPCRSARRRTSSATSPWKRPVGVNVTLDRAPAGGQRRSRWRSSSTSAPSQLYVQCSRPSWRYRA